ncbi:hypothetical protein [Rhizobium tumorigenes]|uniref:hypothetical protein n=1 Tax=Rhizobium tumorigenes TaxID=2041385 RepID=UPI00241D5C68|nr:hypothetical protein [Rhizobium tumorigenes]WFS01530.1 hypothetical protein PR016_02510 [Rhizobium tumorigenes]
MFKREADWKLATKLICDVMRGTATLRVETHSSSIDNGDRKNLFSAWSYNQNQPHQASPSSELRLFSLDHLEKLLVQMPKADMYFAYETPDFQRLGLEAEEALSNFSEILVSSVQLVVGDVSMSWVLVSTRNPRDIILWKMQYHLKDVGFTPIAV